MPRTSSTIPTLSALLLLAGSALAQPTTPAAPATTPAPAAPAPAAAAPTATTPAAARVRSSGIPQRDTLSRLMKNVSIEFKDHRLEDVVKYLTEITGAEFEVFWQDDRNSIGLDKDTPITLKHAKGSALSLLEKVLDKAQTDASGRGNSWQMADSGEVQIGPKERLNKYKSVKLYSVADLLIEIPDYINAPEFDLQTVLQNQGGGGGGGQSPFRDRQQGGAGSSISTKPLDQRISEIQDLLTTLVEPEQWVENGGDGATIRYFQGSFLVNAPDYIHRQIDGYPYWPAENTKVAMVGGRRYVTLGVDTAVNKINGFTNTPVTAVVPGGGQVPSVPPP